MDIASISALVAAVGVIVGVVFTVFELRNLTKTRQTDLVMRLYAVMTGKDFAESWEKVRDREMTDYQKYRERYGFVELNTVQSFFDGVGVLLRRRLVNIGLIDDLFSIEVKMVWEKMQPLAEEVRQIRSAPEMYANIEYLYNEMKKREQRPQQIQQ